MTGFDLGGHREVRRVWRDYYGAMDAVVFMVDASDIFRVEEARSELQSVLTDDGLRRRSVPILIMANKIDAEVTSQWGKNKKKVQLGKNSCTVCLKY